MREQKGFVPVIFVILILIVISIAGGGYVLYKDKQIENNYKKSLEDLKNTPVKIPRTQDEQIPTQTIKQPEQAKQAFNSKSAQLSITKNGFILTGSLCSFDFSLIPQSEHNARRLITLCEKDVPLLEAKFGRGPSAPIYKIQFYNPAVGSQGTGGDARAYAGTFGVFLSTESWGNEFLYDAKILAHELTHVIQSFYGYNSSDYPGWLIEALADYGAYLAGYSNELEKDCYGFSADMQNKTHVYGCTYKFLKFIGNKYDSEIPFKLHKALQAGNYSENLWNQYTGKTFDQLATECSQDSNCGGSYHGGL